jgi:hypothetical protein
LGACKALVVSIKAFDIRFKDFGFSSDRGQDIKFFGYQKNSITFVFMRIRRLVFLYRALLKDLKGATAMSDEVFKRKLRQTSKIARRILIQQRPRTKVKKL